jgi:hypothetical protein
MKTQINGRTVPLRWPCDNSLPSIADTNFADKRRPFSWYSSFAD